MVAFPTVSTGPDRVDTIDEYLREVLEPALAGLGCVVERFDNPVAGHGPLLVGRRHEADDRPTVLVYGHADVVDGLAGQWSHDRDPWRLAQAGAGSQERWYGRGAADNKAQHLVNLSALGILLAEQGRLGFNLTVLIETSEEVGSPGLAEFAQEHRDLLAADVLIASDGPRLAVDVPTLFSVPVAESTWTSTSTCGSAPTTRATGAESCAIRRPPWPGRSIASSTATDGCAWRRCDRPRRRSQCAPRWAASTCTPNRTTRSRTRRGVRPS